MPDTYIEECIKSRHTVKIIMVNGYQMTGVILDENDDCIVVLNGNFKKCVFKHAISTIEPYKN